MIVLRLREILRIGAEFFVITFFWYMRQHLSQPAVPRQFFRLTMPALVVALIGASLPQPATGVSNTPVKTLADATAHTAAAIIPSPKNLPVISAKPRTVRRNVWATVTAYSSTRDQTDASPFITASGTHVHSGTIAWNAVPIGTEVRIPSIYGDKIFVVEDRLNAGATAFHLDIWMTSREEALQWGAQILKIEVLS